MLSPSGRVARKCRDKKLSLRGEWHANAGIKSFPLRGEWHANAGTKSFPLRGEWHASAGIKSFPLRGEWRVSAERGLRLEKLLMKAFPLGGENLSSDSNWEEGGGAADG